MHLLSEFEELINKLKVFCVFTYSYWNRLEMYCRHLASLHGNVNITTGPLYLPYKDEESGKRFVKYEVQSNVGECQAGSGCVLSAVTVCEIVLCAHYVCNSCSNDRYHACTFASYSTQNPSLEGATELKFAPFCSS